MLEKPKKIYFTQIKGTNITGCVIQSPEHDLAEATDANCVIRILAERSLVQPTEKKNKKLKQLITALF